MPKSSPSARSLRLLRQQGHIADVVERWLPRIARKRDLFGFGDIVAVHPALSGALIVQATTKAHVADRVAKARSRAELAVWLRAGGRFQVWGWFKVNGRWKVRRVEVQAEDLQPVLIDHRRPPRRQRKGERQRDLFDVGQ
jgi:hypothetical protein